MSLRHNLSNLALLLSACIPPRSPELVPEPLASPAAPVADCWVLEAVGWAGARQLPGSTRVVFDTVPAHPKHGHARTLVLRPLFAGADTSRAVRIAHWGVRREDGRVHAVLGDGFSGLTFRLELRGDTLRGKASTFIDTWPLIARAGRVRGRRVPCDGPGAARLEPPPILLLARQGAR